MNLKKTLRRFWAFRDPGSDRILIPEGGGRIDDNFLQSTYINSEDAQCFPTLFGCNKVLTQAMINSRVRVVQEENHSYTDYPDHPVFKFFNSFPNPYQTPAELWDMMMRDFNLRGNAYALIHRTRGGQLGELEPVDAYEVGLEFEDTGLSRPRRLIYHIRNKAILHNPDKPKVFHVRQNMRASLPYEGRSPITFLRETIGTGLAATSYQRRLFSQGALNKLALVAPEYMDTRQSETAAQSFKRATQGPDSWHRIPVLPHGMDVKPLGVSNEDIQYIELMRWTKEDTAMAFQIPLPLLQDLSKANLNNIKVLVRSFNRITMAPIQKYWSQACKRCLLYDEPKLQVMFTPEESQEPRELILILEKALKLGILTPKMAGHQMGYEYDNEIPSDEFQKLVFNKNASHTLVDNTEKDEKANEAKS